MYKIKKNSNNIFKEKGVEVLVKNKKKQKKTEKNEKKQKIKYLYII